MIERTVSVIMMAVFLAVTSCARTRPWVQAGAHPIEIQNERLPEEVVADDHGSSNRWTGHVTAYATLRPPVPNARLQPPTVSPDARWIAYLAPSGAEAQITSDGLITGKGLQGVSLWVRAVESAQDPRRIAMSGACWPSWSSDGRLLAFVCFDTDRRSTLGLYDVQTGEIQRKAVGLRCVLMPAFNPDGQRIAVSAYGEVPDQALIFIIDLERNQARPGPPAEHGAQLLPRWVDNRTLLYVELSKDKAHLKRWSIGDDRAVIVAELPGTDSIFDAQHMLAGIHDPLRPDFEAYTYYNLIEDRIEILEMKTLTIRMSPIGFRGGAWWGDDWLVASSDDRVELVSSRRTSGKSDMPRMIRLLTGRWLPIWADHTRQSVILIGEGEQPDTFALMQLWLVALDEDR